MSLSHGQASLGLPVTGFQDALNPSAFKRSNLKLPQLTGAAGEDVSEWRRALLLVAQLFSTKEWVEESKTFVHFTAMRFLREEYEMQTIPKHDPLEELARSSTLLKEESSWPSDEAHHSPSAEELRDEERRREAQADFGERARRAEDEDASPPRPAPTTTTARRATRRRAIRPSLSLSRSVYDARKAAIGGHV